VVVLVVAVQVLAAGGPKCGTSLHMNTGQLLCSHAQCTGLNGNGTCEVVGQVTPSPLPTGWHKNLLQPVTEWTWNSQTKTWAAGFVHAIGQAQIADCQCTGAQDGQGVYAWVAENTCCDLVKVKVGTGFKAGTMGECMTTNCPSTHPHCKPQMNAGGFIAEATCQP